jgi:hypothetical protein
MLDCSTRLTVVAFLGALVALPTASDADSKISRAVLTSKGAVSQPFGNRNPGGVPDRHSPRGVERGADHDRDRYSDRNHDRDRDRYGSRDHDRDRYHGNDGDHDRDRYHGHGHGGCDDDHHDHHRYNYRYSHYYYPPSVFFGFGFPYAHTHTIGCGHVGYWCQHCQFHTTSVEIFYDHVHLAHSVSFATIPSLLVWNPINLVFVFD